MALVVGTNSWVTISESETYLENKINAVEWFALPDTTASQGGDSKENYLVTAFYWIYNYPGMEIAKTSTDENVKNAQIEAALFLLTYGDDYENRRAQIASGLTEFQYSKWEEKLSAGDLTLPAHIIGMLDEYSISGGAAVQMYGEDYTLDHGHE